MSFIEWVVNRERQNCNKILQSQWQSEFITYNECRVASYGSDYRQYIRAFYPKDRSKIKGYIIDIHGGGLIAGEIAQNSNFADWLAYEGYVTFLVEYRLIPEVKFKDQLEDIVDAFIYIKDAVARYPDRPIYLAADSAGCHLALIANALRNNEDLAKIFNVNKTHDLKFEGAWLNAPLVETTGFNKIGLFMAKYFYGQDWKKSPAAEFLKNPYKLYKYLPKNIVIITSKGDSLFSQTCRIQNYIVQHLDQNVFIGYSERLWYEHDWNVLMPDLDNFTKDVNSWGLKNLVSGEGPEYFEEDYD